jgi:hypothetical protein
MDMLWKSYFKDPSQWSDGRATKVRKNTTLRRREKKRVRERERQTQREIFGFDTEKLKVS